MTRPAIPGGANQERLFALGGEVAREEDAWLETQSLEAVRLQVLLAAPKRRSRFVRPLLLCATLAVAAAAVVVFGVGRDRLDARVSGQRLDAGAWIAPSFQEPCRTRDARARRWSSRSSTALRATSRSSRRYSTPASNSSSVTTRTRIG